MSTLIRIFSTNFFTKRHIIHLSISTLLKIIHSQKQSGFLDHPVRNVWPKTVGNRLHSSADFSKCGNFHCQTSSLFHMNCYCHAVYSSNSTWLDSSRLDSTHSTCRAHAFWLCRASQTAQLDWLDTSSSTGATCNLVMITVIHLLFNKLFTD